MNDLIGKDRFDINNIKPNNDYLHRCNRIAPRKNIYVDNELSFISDCSKVATYIKNDYSKWSIGNKTDPCKYLNYAINVVVKINRNLNYSEEQLIDAYKQLATELSECKYSIKSIEDRVLENVKELSNIYYNFNNYINKINENQTTGCQGLSNIVQLYMNNEKTCNSKTNKFCDALDKFKNYYDSKISQVKCDKKEYQLKSFSSFDGTETVTSEEEGRSGLGVKAGRERSAEELGSLPVGSQRSQAVHEEHPESRTESKMLKISEKGFKGEDTSIPDIEGPSESIMNKNVSTIGATFAGSSLFLVMMYKYTPLGSWVSTKILGRNKLMENMEKNYELLLNDVGNREESLKDPMYHIRYNSAAKQ
ncbi:hypothetical protein PVNG_03110 [Plasmodium vivax North Korean]|uniref:Vir protein n=1 Tax=Plasmodium vivax North Korean TaxID=1035514 RepID=A0A0J9U1N9_PLAVI|nr:hypothetical protein PVNG_03110 [Plasmodium vivax North Korean]